MIIRASLWHNEITPYGVAMHHTCDRTLLGSRAEITEQLVKLADNAAAVKLDKTVNAVCINTDDRYIMQVSGYSARRGMYCDVL